MNVADKIEGTVDAWECGELGLDESYVSVVGVDLETEIESSIGLQAISIRLEKTMIDEYKALAKFHGISGYQPLMRDVLKRFVESEMKSIALGVIESQALAQSKAREPVKRTVKTVGSRTKKAA